jgi:hypothetical protein
MGAPRGLLGCLGCPKRRLILNPACNPSTICLHKLINNLPLMCHLSVSDHEVHWITDSQLQLMDQPLNTNRTPNLV